MSKLPKVLLAVAFLAGVVALGWLVGWLGSRGPTPPLPPPEVVAAPGTAVAAPNPPGKGKTRPTPSAGTNPQAPDLAAVAAADTNLITNWEEKIDAILTADGETDDKAKQMIELFPRLPEAGQEEVAKHLSNLVSDENYDELTKLLIDPNLPPGVLEALFGDALNRPNSLKLPALLQVARDPDHIKAIEAKDILALFLEEDHGTDWDQWQTAVDKWLKKNPD
jgi:hypothetical protein